MSAKTCMFSLLGPQADAVMQQLQAAGISGAPYGAHTLLSFRGARGYSGIVNMPSFRHAGPLPRRLLLGTVWWLPARP